MMKGTSKDLQIVLTIMLAQDIIPTHPHVNDVGKLCRRATYHGARKDSLTMMESEMNVVVKV